MQPLPILRFACAVPHLDCGERDFGEASEAYPCPIVVFFVVIAILGVGVGEYAVSSHAFDLMVGFGG